jgi:hypothetical protein
MAPAELHLKKAAAAVGARLAMEAWARSPADLSVQGAVVASSEMVETDRTKQAAAVVDVILTAPTQTGERLAKAEGLKAVTAVVTARMVLTLVAEAAVVVVE